MFTNPIPTIRQSATRALLARMPHPERRRLLMQVVGAMSERERQEFLVAFPNFIPFARAFLLSIGKPRATTPVVPS